MLERMSASGGWRLRSSFISSVISTTIVLYMLGLLALVLVNIHRLSEYVKENLGISVVLAENVKQVDAEFLRKTIDATPWVKESYYVSKDEAAEELEKSLGQDFLTLLKYNPLSPSIELKVRAPWANNDSLSLIAESLVASPLVSDVHYEPNLVDLVNANARRFSGLLLSFSALMCFIAIVLINNTIRISIYARRFIIKTMQLVGATPGFVRRPFLVRAARHGLVASVLAFGLLLETVYLVQGEFYELVNLRQYAILGLVGVFILLSGVIINVLTTYFAVNKYLQISVERLYY